jgi:hypothetical protein
VNNKKRLESIVAKQQDLIRDFQYCLNTSDDDSWKDFFGTLAREQAELAHRCLEKIARL